jgi:ATPase subunit of ABC transporter with duplicated ATPase domains
MTTQAMQALNVAQERRLGAVEWRRRVATLPINDARWSLVEALEEPDGPYGCLLLHRFLQAPKGMGLAATRRLVTSAHLRPASVLAPVRDLSPGERGRLIQALKRRDW